MNVFVHKRGEDIKMIEVEETIKVSELVEKVDDAGGHVWLEEKDEELDLEATLVDVGIGDRSHIHIGHCKKVKVAVRYNGVTKEYDVSPATTLKSIYERAASQGEGFGLSESDRAHDTLQIQGTTEQPDLSRHIGVFADDDCSAKFDLVPQGGVYQG